MGINIRIQFAFILALKPVFVISTVIFIYIANILLLSYIFQKVLLKMWLTLLDIQACPETFAPTTNGIYKYLKHANKYFHTTVSNCRKCTLPEFRIVVNNIETISHFCIKIGKPICVMKS